MSDPPQHLLGGLEVAILVAQGSNSEQLHATKTSLEEVGMNVMVVGPDRGAMRGSRGDGTPGVLEVSQRLSLVDPDSFDAVLVIADPKGARQLASAEETLHFLSRMDAAGKPIGAISDGVLPLLMTGLASSPAVSASDHLTRFTASTGSAPTGDSLTVHANVVLLREHEGLDQFNAALKRLLARRRQASTTIGNDAPGAAGEDG